ncbi:hypothetical protein ACFSTH_03585 [Paenibacillus yanchengensis]|uniref:Transposase n=1 Tax=Paenibacillus yanchengensis TaxID=2035833 RepID=A0ABW4YFQ8_9BACL
MLRFEKALNNIEQRGIKQGIQEGKLEGMQEGERKAKEEIVKRMLNLGVDINIIAAATEFSITDIEQVQK